MFTIGLTQLPLFNYDAGPVRVFGELRTWLPNFTERK
jgi:hypothetical protein